MQCQGSGGRARNILHPGLLQGGTQGLFIHHPHLLTEPLCLHSEHFTRTHLVDPEEDSSTYHCLPLATLKVVPWPKMLVLFKDTAPPHPDPRLTHPHQGLPRDCLTLYDTWRRLPLPEPGVKPSMENTAAKEKGHTKIPRHQINCPWLFTFSHSPQETPGDHVVIPQPAQPLLQQPEGICGAALGGLGRKGAAGCPPPHQLRPTGKEYLVS